MSFALNDCKEKELQEPCDDPYDKSCQSCEILKTSLNELKDQIKNLVDKDDDLLYCYQRAVLAIESWKSHLLRPVHQDKALTDILESLDESSLPITQDWAMKFQPQKLRETQADWFGKREILWHISAVVHKVQSNLQQ